MEEEEEGMAGVKDHIKAHLKERRKGRKGGGGRRGLAVMIWMTVPSLRVGVGKRRNVARQGRFSRGGVGSGGRGLDVEEVIGHLRCLSEEDRWRCMRTFKVPSDGEVSALSDDNSGGAAIRVALLIDGSA